MCICLVSKWFVLLPHLKESERNLHKKWWTRFLTHKRKYLLLALAAVPALETGKVYNLNK